MPTGGRTRVAKSPAMPRKQRFKPSRKQPSQQQQQPQVGKEQQEIHPDDVDVETEIPARGKPEISDIERSH